VEELLFVALGAETALVRPRTTQPLRLKIFVNSPLRAMHLA